MSFPAENLDYLNSSKGVHLKYEKAMAGKYIFTIDDQNSKFPEQVPENRIIYSSLHRFETEAISKGLSIKLPLEGEEKYILDKRSFKIAPGEYMLTHNGQMVGYELKKRKAIKGLCIYLEEELVKKAFTSCLSGNEEQLNDPTKLLPSIPLVQGRYILEQNRLSHILNFIKDGPSSQTNPEFANEIFYEISFELGRQWMEDKKRKAFLEIKKKSTKDEIYLRLQKTRQFMHDEYGSTLNIREIAEAGSFSEFHFIRCFKSCYGCSPYQDLLSIRIEKAKEMLLEKKYPVGEVAIKAGFTDVFMFSKTFKKLTGMPPSSFKF